MDSDVQTIKDRLSINDVVGQYIQLQRAGRNFRARCPFHKEKTPSFFISPERGTYMCFGCGEKGDIFSFVQKMDGIDFATALRQLAHKAGVELHQNFTTKDENKGKDERLRDALEAATAFFESQLAKRVDAQEYLRSRGVHDDTVKMWRLGFAPAAWRDLTQHLLSLGFTKDEIVEAGLAATSLKKPGEVYDRFRGRIMCPIFDGTDRVIAFSGRYFEDIAPKTSRLTGSSADASQSEAFSAKYVNSPETALFKKSRVLYGFNIAKNAIRKADCVLLVEGQFDLILSHQSGLPYTVALSGTALTPEHLSLIGRLSKRLVLALDADAAGIRAGLRSTQMALQAGFDVKVPAFPEGKDPADLARENPELLKAAIRTSKTAIEFFLDALRPQAKDARSYAKLVEVQILPLVVAIPSSIDREHFVRIVAQRLSVSEAAVRTELNKKPVRSIEIVSDQVSSVDEPAMGFEKKVGMLVYYFGKNTDTYTRLEQLLGAERLAVIEAELQQHAEWLRFKFESEVGEHSTEVVIAQDMFSEIERIVEKERFKMKFL